MEPGAVVRGIMPNRPAAGKTGTSNDNASAWFNGYTPQMAASVSFYRDDATQSLNGIGGLTSVTGGSFPARIWATFAASYLKNQPVADFPSPVNIGGTAPVDLRNSVPTLPLDSVLNTPTPKPSKSKKR